MEILASNVDPRAEDIVPSFAVPAIQRTSGGPGRKREVDFVVVSRAEHHRILLCIEAKWAGSSHASEENILIDVARMALVSRENPGTTRGATPSS
jgi:hypothetical protein